MKRMTVLLLALLGTAACDWGLGTDPGELTLDDVSDPPRDHATVVLTETLTDELGRELMKAGTEYFFPLRTPPPLPELLFDAVVGGGSPLVRVILLSATETGDFSTEDGVGIRFGSPDGRVFDPRTACGVSVERALDATGAGRLQGQFDCPMVDETGEIELRVLSKFDHSP